jgi:hypothetical protein
MVGPNHKKNSKRIRKENRSQGSGGKQEEVNLILKISHF